MSIENLVAQIGDAREQNSSARDVLTQVSGALKGISLAVEFELREVGRLSNHLTDQVNKARVTLRSLPIAEGDSPTLAKTFGGDIVRNGVSHNRALTEQSEARAQQVGTDSKRSGRDAKNFPGSNYHSHAERLAERLEHDQPGAVNRPMCNGYDSLGRNQWVDADCISHYQNMAEHDGKIKVWADPDSTRIFHPDTQIDHIAHNARSSSIYQSSVEAITRSLERQGGSRFEFMQAMQNSPLRRGSKALGPLGMAFDAFSLHQAYEADGGRMGEEFKTTAGGVVGGVVGGAAVGAAVGSVVPGVGTVIGGVVGGIIGSMAGERIGAAL